MENNYSESKIVNKKEIKFEFKGKIYNLKAVISLNYLRFFNKNKGKLSNYELAISCITMSNNSFSDIIGKLNKEQKIYILNKYIKLSNISKTRISSYKEFCEEIQNYYYKSIEMLHNQINKSINYSMSNIAKNLQLAMTPLIDSMAEMQRQIKKAFSNNYNTWCEIFERIRIVSEEINNYMPEYDKLLMKLGYPPIDFDLSEIKYIVDNKDDRDICNILDCLIIKEYDTKELYMILNKWQGYSFLENRISLLSDGVNACIKGQYSLSIPLLLTQLEGSVVEFFNIEGKSNMNKYKKYTLELLDNFEIDDYGRIAKTYFMQYILAEFFHGDSIPKFSRHAIMHGADIGFGTQINNINLILTLDIIFECMNNVKLVKDN